MKKNFLYAVLAASLLLCGCEKEQLIDELNVTERTEVSAVQIEEATTAASTEEPSQTTFAGLGETEENSPEKSIAAEMPEPFTGGFDGAAAEMYIMPVQSKMNEIPPELLALRDDKEVGDWLSDADAVMALVRDKNAGPISLAAYANVYSFVRSFDIAREEGEAILEEYHGYTAEELEAVFSEDTELICRTFANDYAIVEGDMMYTPQWVYWHGAEDYKAKGIPPEMLAEKAPLYAELPFSNEAREAFAAKLSAYTGENISLTISDGE